MTWREFLYWKSYFNQKAKLEEQANKPKKDGAATREFKKTMGSSP